MKKRPKSFYLTICLGLIALSYPLFYLGGTGNDSATSLIGLGLALLAGIVTIAFC